jgi:hypothetical protein
VAPVTEPDLGPAPPAVAAAGLGAGEHREHERELPPARDNGSRQDEANAAPSVPAPPEALPFTPAASAPEPEAEPDAAEAEDASRPIRRGWWQRRFTST